MDGNSKRKSSGDPTAAAPQFVHLHLHTEYSLLDGGNRINRLIDRVKDLGMSAVAVTDHGNLFGAMEFYKAARAGGVKPIMGIEAYIAPDRDGKRGDRRERVQTGTQDGGFHLVLLAMDLTGWHNLVRLSSDAYLQGFYYRPRMDKSTLESWNEGLIAINGHLGSSIAFHLCNYLRTADEKHWESALAEARWHRDTFGVGPDGKARFYIELQRHIEEQEKINPLLKKLARELSLPLVCDNDAHFMLREDHDVHDTLCCISMGKNKESPDRLRYSEELYVKSPQEMAQLFADEPEAIANAVDIAARCNVEFPAVTNHAPVVRVNGPTEPARFEGGDLEEWHRTYCRRFELLPFDETRDSSLSKADLKLGCDRALSQLAEAGLIWRYGSSGVTPAVRVRFDRELRVLADKGISAYFLIVWDFVNWARQQGIPATARGSGVGTMVGYVLGLSNACPERFGLLFERFTDPDRSEYPDIDIDLCQDGRQRVIEYVRKKYGHVAQIITFGRLKARAAIKDVSRVMGLTPSESQRLANLVPSELHITIEEAVAREPALREACEDAVVAKVIETAKALEDHARHAGVHAAGVIIATQPLEGIVPLCRLTGSEDAVTQWDGPTCESIGLLKMDFLGLRTLSTIELAKKLIAGSISEEFLATAAPRTDPLDLDRIDFEDQRVLELFCRADTGGVFQFESAGMRRLLCEMKPDRLEDLIAANALFRPGPMELSHEYCARKHGRQAIPRLHEVVSRFTDETYGVMVYQEQVMQVLHHLGGIPLRQAYSIIKAISKKKVEVIDGARADFVAGSVAKGMSESRARELFDLILKFAGYGFNKSHSTGYAIIAYQTAYLKTYFPNQYMAAVLSFESQARKIEDWAVYLEDCRRTQFPDHTVERPHVGIEVRPPDINLSAADFAVVYGEGEPRDSRHGHIRFGLRAIKSVGDGAISAIIKARTEGGAFHDLFEFCGRVDMRQVNRAAIESLAKAGTFDSLHGAEARAAIVSSIEDAIRAGQSLAQDRRDGQMNMFAMFAPEPGGASATPKARVGTALKKSEAWDRLQSLSFEKEALGFNWSGHPLDEYRKEIETFCPSDTAALKTMHADAPAVCGCIVTRVRQMVSQRGKSPGSRMATIAFEDKHGTAEGVLFPDQFAKHGASLQVGKAVALIGFVDRSRAEAGIKIDRVIDLADASAHLATRLEVVIREQGTAADEEPLGPRMRMAAGLLRQAAGSTVNLRGKPVEVQLRVETKDGAAILVPHGLRLVADRALLHQLSQVLPGSVAVMGGWLPEPRARRGSSAYGQREVEVG
ncbi:MAG: DNA polymerase III subunit alpha [Phycisphaerales bacterium]|nr:DNA polymerase III subunit alpha [Phycisphaerales bacterium]